MITFAPEIVQHLKDHMKTQSAASAVKVRYLPALSAYAAGITVSDLRKSFNLTMLNATRQFLQAHRVTTTLPLPRHGFLFKTLNGSTVLDIDGHHVLKIIAVEHEPLFLENERRAKELLPQNTPEILESGLKDGYAWVITNLEDKNSVAYWRDWPKLFCKLLPVLRILYHSGGLQNISAEAYKVEVTGKLEALGTQVRFLKPEILHVAGLLKTCLARYRYHGDLAKVFSHGDLVPNNLIITKNSMLLCDWANGGVLNSLYDLMLQDFYSPNRLTWKNFDTIDFLNDRRREIFFGAGPAFLKTQNDVVTYTNEMVRLSLLLALAELLIKNALRYQTESEWRDGAGMISNVRLICEHILSSA